MARVVRETVSSAFIKQVLDFSMTNEDFSYLGLRVLDHFSLSEDLRVRIIGFGGIQIALGLVRTGDYESVVSALSLLSSLVVGEQVADFVRCNGIRVLIKLLQQQEPEYAFFVLALIDTILASEKHARDKLLHIGLHETIDSNVLKPPKLQEYKKIMRMAKRIKNEIKVWEGVVPALLSAPRGQSGF
mmetsp:Transcript_18151/g.32509  ORF Transcript_18151/g.32509 Transcript_18151/m.32509 type:complete len:187 (+) Transcript_18151:140-700(+)